MQNHARQNLYTTVAPFEDRRLVWEQAVVSAEQHVKLGQTLQGQGVEILKAAQQMQDDPTALSRLIQQSTATIDRGTRIERDARDKLIELNQQVPKDR